MIKTDFIPFIKKISDKLTEEDIKHDIPTMFKSQIDFNHIFFIIPDTTKSFELAKIFFFDFVKEQYGKIYAKMANFPIIFILSSEDDWKYKYYYYSWNNLRTLINTIYYNFNIKYTNTGLFYIYNNKKILLTKNMTEIFDFLNLDFKMLVVGFQEEFDIYKYVMSSQYFDSDYYNVETLKKLDPVFKYNEKFYDKFLDFKSNIKGTKKSEEEIISLLDAYFPESKLYETLIKLNFDDFRKET